MLSQKCLEGLIHSNIDIINEKIMTNINQLQTLKIACEECGQKHLKTVAWLVENRAIQCECGHQTNHNNIEQVVLQAMNELK